MAAALVAGRAEGSDHWSLEAYGGDAFNFRNRLEITQDGGYSQSLSAKYRTRGLRTPLYWVLRGARWRDDAAWELSLIHHKLYLTNPPPGVSDLSVSHPVRRALQALRRRAACRRGAAVLSRRLDVRFRGSDAHRRLCQPEPAGAAER